MILINSLHIGIRYIFDIIINTNLDHIKADEFICSRIRFKSYQQYHNPIG